MAQEQKSAVKQPLSANSNDLHKTVQALVKHVNLVSPEGVAHLVQRLSAAEATIKTQGEQLTDALARVKALESKVGA